MNTSWNMHDKTILVTGGTQGIGYETARGLAALDATVIIASRNATRGADAVTSIQRQTGNTKISFIQADLSSLSEIHRLAEYITAHYPQLHVLVNNAGGLNAQRRITADGLEATFAINHVAPFLLTNLLLPLLQASAPARIVNVNSVQHRPAQIDFANLQQEKNYDAMGAYRQAKLANLFFTYALVRRLRGTNVTVNAADPLGTLQGAQATAAFLPLSVRLITPVLALFPHLFPISRAAQSSIYLASSPDVPELTGKYINFRKKIIRSSPASYDESTAEELWRISAELTNLEQKDLQLKA